MRDCAKWRREIDVLTPTVRFDARDRSNVELSGVTVSEAGKAVASSTALVPVEPGAHVYRFEKSGFAPTDVRVELHAGEQGRVVLGTLAAEAHVAPAAAPASAQPTMTAPPPADIPPSRTAAYVVGGVSAALLVAAGVLAIKGLADRSSLRSSCAPTCNDSQLGPIRTEWWVAGGLGVAGALGAGVAVFLYTRDERSRAALPTVTLSPRYATLRWTFD